MFAPAFILVGENHLINLALVHHIEHDQGTIHFFFENGKQVIVEGDWPALLAELTPKESPKKSRTKKTVGKE